MKIFHGMLGLESQKSSRKYFCRDVQWRIFLKICSAWPQQLTLCRSLHAEALQAVASEGLAQVFLHNGIRPSSRKISTLPMGYHAHMSNVLEVKSLMGRNLLTVYVCNAAPTVKSLAIVRSLYKGVFRHSQKKWGILDTRTGVAGHMWRRAWKGTQSSKWSYQHGDIEDILGNKTKQKSFKNSQYFPRYRMFTGNIVTKKCIQNCNKHTLNILK